MIPIVIFSIIIVLHILQKSPQCQKKKDNISSPSKKYGQKDYGEIFKGIYDISSLEKRYSSLKIKNKQSIEALIVLEKLYKEKKAQIIKKDSQEKKAAAFSKNESLFVKVKTLDELKQKFRKLAKLNHPDNGGSHAAMKKLNELYENAKKNLRHQT